MRARERIIRERLATRACATCGGHYADSGLVVLAHRGSAWVVLATCPMCERRNIFFVSFRQPSSTESDDHLPLLVDDILISGASEDAEAPPTTAQGGGISADDVLSMRAFLSAFDGDFKRLFDQE